MPLLKYKLNVITIIYCNYLNNCNNSIRILTWDMGTITDREKEIMQLLRTGKTVKEIAKTLKIAESSVSGSISRIRLKTHEIEEDINFLEEIGLLCIEKGRLKFVSRDPKVLGKLGQR